MERFFQIRDWWGNGLALWVVVLLLVSIPVLAVVVKDVTLENNVTSWLPSGDPDAKALAWFTNEFERDDRIIVSWDSSSLNDERLEKFARAVQGDGANRVNGVLSVSTPRSVIEKMLDNNVERDDAIQRLTGVLIGVGFLKVNLTDAGRDSIDSTKQLIVDTAVDLLDESVELVSAVPNKRAEAPDGNAEDESRLFAIPEHDFQLRWEEMSANAPHTQLLIDRLYELEESNQPLIESVFFAPGAPVAATLALQEIADRDLPQTLADIRAAAIASGVPAEEIRMAGSPIGRAGLNQAASRSVWNRDYPAWNLYKRTPVLLSALVGVFVAFILLRSLRLSILVTLTSVFTCLVVVALIPLTGKSLNMVLIVLPDLMLVLTTSGAIHVANYWKNAVMHNEPNPIAGAVKMAWQPCALASITTAIGMASLLSAVLEPVREFGLYSSLGCFVSLFMILIGFPSLMSIWPGRAHKYSEHAEKEATWWGRTATQILRHRLVVCGACLVLFVVSVVGLRWFETETKVIRYFPDHTRIAKDYRFLEEGLAGIVSLDAVVYFSPEQVDELNIDERIEIVRTVENQLAEHRWISGTLSLADFRDPFEDPGPDASVRSKIMYRRGLQRKENTIFESGDKSIQEFARKADESLTVSQHDGRQVKIDAGDEIWRIRAQSIVTGEVDYSILTADMNEIVHAAVDDSGADYLVTGMVPLFLRTQEAVLESLIKSFGLAFGVIALIMMFLLRSFTSGLLAMIPNLFPVGVVFGIFSWMQIPVDIGTMITASVALGIAVDGTLHLLTWYQDGIRRGVSQHDSVVLALQHCGPAMWQTSASIALGIVMVSGADLLLISRFGLLMAGLVAMALVADVVLLPALLGGWLGRVIENNCKKSQTVQEPQTIEFPQTASTANPVEHQPVSPISQNR